ncbi:MAG: 4'-phosphopantetheinyl transferase family protein [Acutalibacter sp.]|jgi:4'-phosphopantetheinyl transferase
MLYVVRYACEGLSRREELSHQRSLAQQLLRRALWEERGLRLSDLRQERTPEGKPYFPDCSIHFNLSHCHGMVCCALSAFPVGVDGEGPRPFREALARRACTQEELSWLLAQPDHGAAFLTLWTLKESVMKLTGQGLAYGLKHAAFTFEEGAPRFLPGGVELSQYWLPGGFVVAAASRKERFLAPHMLEL